MILLTDVLRLIYSVCITFLGLFAAGTCLLVLAYLIKGRDKPAPKPLPDAALPKVTIQLPLYNERYVARRIIEAAAAMDYPREKLHIQVLDDSTDDTTDLIQGKVAQLRADGHHIDLIHRTDRTGFKAGALANGMKHTDSDFIAIFDADFVPPPDFLRKTMPYFESDRIGMVQTRWGHLNDSDNVLTRGQALAIDGHFAVDQYARYHAGLVFIFNGTGGIWRRKAMEEAGGWSADTLCEDFDLSYRALIKGWKFAYTRDVVVPGELPSQMASYKQQQARWAKGSTQVLMKLLVPVMRSRLGLLNRFMGFLQMMQYAVQLFMIALIMLTPPMIVLRAFKDFYVVPYSLLALSAPLLYALGQIYLQRGNWWRRMLYFPVLMLFGSGMSLNNGWAALSAFLGIKTEFKRTPKFHQDGHSIHWIRSQYTGLLTTPDIGGEIFMMLYTMFGAILALELEPVMAGYMVFYALSYGAVVGWSLYDRWLIVRPQRRTQNVDTEAAVQQPGR